jgi:hypothetical protein
MKLLSREGGRFVFFLTDSQLEHLQLLFGLAGLVPPVPPRVSRPDDPSPPDDAAQSLTEAIAQTHRQNQAAVLVWIQDPVRCAQGKGGFGLTLTPDETVTLLQAVNATKVGLWQALGCPDPYSETTIPDLRLHYVMRYSEHFLVVLLDALEGTD